MIGIGVGSENFIAEITKDVNSLYQIAIKLINYYNRSMTLERFIKGKIINPIVEGARRQREQSQQQQQLEAVRGEINALVEDIFPNDTVKEYTFHDPELEWPSNLTTLVNLHPEIAEEDLRSISVFREYLGFPTVRVEMHLGYFTEPPYYTVTSSIDRDRSRVEVYSVASTFDARTQVYSKGDYVGEMLRLNLIKESLSFAKMCQRSENPTQ